MATFFSGEYHHQVDEKMRIRIPAKLKELLGENPFITRGSDNNLLVIPKSDAEQMLSQAFGDVTFTDVDQHQAVRLMCAYGFTAEEDKQGRILLPPQLIRYAQIQKNVVTIGSYRYVEIWSEENWEKYNDITEEEFKQSLREVRKLRLANL